MLYEQVARTVAAQDVRRWSSPGLAPPASACSPACSGPGMTSGASRLTRTPTSRRAPLDLRLPRREPLALAVSVGTLALPTALGLRPLAESQNRTGRRPRHRSRRACGRCRHTIADQARSSSCSLRMATDENPVRWPSWARRLEGNQLQLAWQFTEHRYDLIIAAKDAAMTTPPSSSRRRQQVEAMQVDLAAPAPRRAAISGRSIGIAGQAEFAVALDAGIGDRRPFATGLTSRQD